MANASPTLCAVPSPANAVSPPPFDTSMSQSPVASSSVEDEEEVPLPTTGAFANLRPYSPPPLERTDSQREADQAWARAVADTTSPAVAPLLAGVQHVVPDRALTRSCPPSISSPGDSRATSPHVGGGGGGMGGDEDRFSDVEDQDEVPDLPELSFGTTPALTVDGPSPRYPASSNSTPFDGEHDDADEEDVPLPSGKFANVLQRAFSPIPVPKDSISPPPEDVALPRNALAPANVSSPILLAAIHAYERQSNRHPTASAESYVSPSADLIISPPCHVVASPPLVAPRPEKPRTWSGHSSPQTSHQAMFGMTSVTSSPSTSAALLPASTAIDLEALELEAERSRPASRAASRRPSMAARMQSDEVVLGLNEAFANAKIALERANAEGRRYQGPAYRPILSPDEI